MGQQCSSCHCKPLASVSKKIVMAITGLLLCGFVLTHFLGNLTLFIGSDAFNKYSHALTSNPLIYGAEVVLGLLFLSHIVMGIRLVRENRAARPIAYHVQKNSGRGATIASSTMPYTGIITLIFLVLHIIGLKFGTHYTTTVGGIEMRDIYKTTAEYFADLKHVIIYIIAVTSLGLHVSHGLWSALQTFGINHPRYTSKFKCIARAYGVLVAVGFSSFPIYLFIVGVK